MAVSVAPLIFIIIVYSHHMVMGGMGVLTVQTNTDSSLELVKPKNNSCVSGNGLKKTLGRVGYGFFFENWNLNYKDPNEKKKGIFVKKSLGRPVPIGRVGLPETQDILFRP